MQHGRVSIEKVLAVSTVDNSELMSPEFARLLDSADGVIDRLVLIVRGQISEENLSMLDRVGMPQLTILFSEEVGVSAARNRGLLWLYSNIRHSWESTAVIFPDADAWFSEVSRKRIQASLNNERGDLAVGPYGPSDKSVIRSRWPAHVDKIDPQGLLALVASAGIVFRMSVLAQIGFFDERLGVGAPAGAAEDVEIVLRSFLFGAQISYFHLPFLYHPYKKSRHHRIIGGVAVVFGYRQHFSLVLRARYLLRSVIDKSRSIPRFTPITAISALLIARSFVPMNPVDFREKISVGGLEITRLSPAAVLPEIARGVLAGQYTRVLGAHITALNARKNRQFYEAFNQADFALVDGISVSLAARISRHVRLEKLATTDYAETLFRTLFTVLGRPPRTAIIGGEPGIAEAAGEALQQKKLVEVVSSFHGYQEDMRVVLESIRQADPEVLIVGMGMPIEATEVARWGSDSSAKLVITCGGWLRLLAGSEQRSPRIWQSFQMEWLWRLLTDPRRTSRRYFLGTLSILAVGFGARR